MMEKQQVSRLICNYEWPQQNLSSQRQCNIKNNYIIKQTSDEDNEKFQ